jgi:S-DNA-T family DNA segregation ATPase FtsK/SpoIIIE
MMRRYIQYGCAVALCACAVLIAVSLWSYNPTDCSFTYVDTAAPQPLNYAHAVGSHTAAVLIYLLGNAAWLLLCLLLFVAWLLARNERFADHAERVGALLALPVLVAMMIAFADPSNVTAAGWFGTHGYLLLQRMFDPFMVRIGLYTVSACMIILATRLHFVPYVVYAVRMLLMLIQAVIVALALPYRLMMRCKGMQQKEPHTEKEPVVPVTPTYAAADTLTREDERELFASKDLAQDDLLDDDTYADDEADAADEDEDTLYADDHDEHAYADADEPLLSPKGAYHLPNVSLFISNANQQDDPQVHQHLQEQAHLLEQKLKRFGVAGKVVAIKRGPVVTLFEYEPEMDAKISKITALEDDLALALQALSIRIIAPIPGKSVVGFEVANRVRESVYLADIVHSPTFNTCDRALPLALGYDTIGNDVIVDLVRMPHLLVAGSTGSGKSIALNTMLVSLLCKRTPDELKLILIDPKRLEFAAYADIAHLIFPIITHPKKAAPALRWVVQQMEERYEMMAEVGARNMQDYNVMMKKNRQQQLPYIVVVIDELADLMMTAGKEIEDLIARIAQMARAAGIHMIVATQRPSVDVITGLIKVNFPSRISFRVTSKIDSRTILDASGADKLLGRGDMLYLDASDSSLKRLHGAYVSDTEIQDLVTHIKAQRAVEYLDLNEQAQDDVDDHEMDGLYDEVLVYLQEIDEISISQLQRKFRIGYNRSARIIELLEVQGFIGPSGKGKTRSVLRQ